jgi:hypothetical protein
MFSSICRLLGHAQYGLFNPRFVGSAFGTLCLSPGWLIQRNFILKCLSGTGKSRGKKSESKTTVSGIIPAATGRPKLLRMVYDK